MSATRPVIALTLGDPAGIGPELIARLVAEPEQFAETHSVLVGDQWLWEQGQRQAGLFTQLPRVASFDDARQHEGLSLMLVESVAQQDVTLAEESAACGASTLAVLSRCLEAAQNEEVDAICFAPLNKLSMKKGGLGHEDELHFFAEKLGVEGYFCEFNTLGTLWTSRISSHIPLKDAAEYVTQERIIAASQLIHDSLKLAGFEHPRIAVAAFNPHGGEGGTCGREEIDVIAPAVARCNEQGYPVEGPFPADTIFLKARDGEYDAIVTMYHDQGQIAIKLLGFKSGVTVQGGLPIPITTPAHGTAFDIAGQGKADVNPTRNAFAIAKRMGTNLRALRLETASA